MEQGLPPVTPSRRLPRLLIAEKDFSAIEPLIRTCGDKRLDVDFDVCSSHRGAVGMLLASSYQLVICGAHLTEMEDFSLLRRIQAQDSFVPVVVTASASEKESARLALLKGAFDLIPTPLEHEQTVVTIRLALWQSTLMDLIAHKEKTLEKYRQHLAAYPDNRKSDENFNRALLSIEKTVSAFEQTIQRVEESIRCFADLAVTVENQARERALKRLESSCGPPHGGSSHRFT